MSTTIDQRVVEMQFDNRHFERNVSTTISTLDKLKQSLNLTGASKGLESVNTAASRVNMNGLGNAVESVRLKFSALEVMGVTALVNLTNSALNAGKRIASALTIDPVKSGFQEYETQINAVQTILANTKSKGSTLDDVNQALEELNKYADMTIYNFTEMTRNIGTFTAAGVDLDTSVNAIKGIANLAAVSGSTSQQASTAMYQLSQALASGTVKLMDWNSVVNAGMGGEVFQNALKETARIHGVAIDAMIESEGSFRETLKDGWLTSEILTDTLQKFTYYAEEGTTEWNEYMKALQAEGYTEAQAREIMELGKTATEAATKVKTLTQLWDVLKEAAQSGWAQSWKIMVGDFEEAKNLFSPLADTLTGFLNKMSDARNILLEKIFGSPIVSLADKIEKFAESTKAVTDALLDYEEIANRIIGGEFGNGQTRWDKLTEMGYDWAHAQNIVNEKLGDATRHATDYTEAQTGVNEAIEEGTSTKAEALKKMIAMSNSQLRTIGLTTSEIDALRQLEMYSEKTGISIESLAEDMDQLNGRTLLINAFKNVGTELTKVFETMGDAWKGIFDSTTDEKAARIYDIIAAFHKFSLSLEVDENMADKLTRTFKGLFAIIDIITTVTGGAFKFAFEVLKEVLSYFNLDILDITANIGDAIVGFRDWIDSIINVKGVVETLMPILQNGAQAVKDWYAAFKESDFYKAGVDIIQGLINGITDKATAVWDKIVEVATGLINKFKEKLEIHSPSQVFFESGVNIVEGLVNGIANGTRSVLDAIKNLGASIVGWFRDSIDWEGIGNVFKNGFSKVAKFLSDIDFGAILLAAVGISGGIAVFRTANKAIDALSAFSAPLEGLGEMFESIGEGLESKYKAAALQKQSKALLNMALAIGVVAGAIYLLAQLETDKLLKAAGVVVGIVVVLGLLALVVSKLDGLNFDISGKTTLGILGLALSLLLITQSLKQLASVEDVNKLDLAMKSMLVIMTGLAGFFALYGTFVKGKAAQNISGLGKTLLTMAGSILVLVLVAKILAGMETTELIKAGACILAVGAFVAMFSAISMIPGKNVNKIGGMLLKVAGAMAILVIVGKVIAGMRWDELEKAGAGLAGLAAIMAGLIFVTQMAGGNDVGKIGTTLLAISGAMAILVLVGKMLVGMEWSEMGKAAVGLIGLSGVIAILIQIVKLAGNDAPKIGLTLLALSASLAIMAGVAALLGLVKIENLVKGIVAIGLLSSFVALMIHATKGAEDCMKNLIVMTVAIGVMAAAVGILSLIDPTALASATLALGTVMVLFGVMAKMSSGMTGAMGSLIVMTVAIGVLAGAIYLLATLEVESALGAAASISVLLLSMSASMALVGTIGKTAITAVGALAVMGIVVAELAVILGLMAHFDINPSLETVVALSALLLAMSGSLVILGVVGSMGPAAFVGIGALATLIAGSGGLVVGIGALMSEFPALEEFLNKGIPVIEQIGDAIGSFFGNIVGGFLDGVSDGFVSLADNLSEFMDRLQPFIEGAKQIGGDTLTGVKNLAEIVLLLTAADVLNGLTSWFTGGNSLADFGSELGELGNDLREFATNLGSFSEAQVVSITCAADALKAIAGAAKEIPNEGGWVGTIFGENSLSSFASEFPGLGTNLSEFVTNLGSFGEAQVTSIDCAGRAISALAVAADEIPNDGGWLGAIFGENSLSTFASDLPDLGTNLANFVSNLGTFSDSQVTTVDCAGRAVSALALAASEIPNEGGWLGAIFGENGLASFGSQLADFGTNMAAFVANLGTFTDAQVETVSSAVAAMNALSGLTTAQNGGTTLGYFGEELVTFGVKMRDYCDEIKEIDYDKLDKAVSYSYNLASFIRSIAGLTADGTDAFEEALEDLKDAPVTKFVANYSESSATARANVKNLATMIDELQVNTKGVKKFTDALADLADLNVEKVVNNFKNSVQITGGAVVDNLLEGMKSKDAMVTNIVTQVMIKILETMKGQHNSFLLAGGSLMEQFSKGIDLGASNAKVSVTNMMTEAVNELRGNYAKFYAAGSYMVTGFCNGIDENTFRAKAVAKAMAKAAVEAAEEELEIQSPSRVMRRIGAYTGEGFILGLADYESQAYDSGYGIAEYAKNGLSKAIAKVQNVINNGMDDNLTIRPVLDLSDVESGVARMSGLFGNGSSVGVLANVGAISSMMGRRGQNGGNTDVVAAIDKLRSDLSGMAGPSYTINGVNYNDDSDVADALRTIVNAAIREGRS